MSPALIVIPVALIVGYFAITQGGYASGEQAKSLVQAGARLIDVRTPGEFATGHLAGAVNIPLQQLTARVGELEPKDVPIVLYCRSGVRSSKAARKLKAAGFAAVHNLGAMSRW